MVNKLKSYNDKAYPIDVIVSWAIRATKALQTCYGFSPNLSSNLVSLPSALENVCHADIKVKQLSAIHAARKVFTEAESNDKLSRVLKAKKESNNRNRV